MRRAGASFGAVLAILLAAAYVLGGPMPQAGTSPDGLLQYLSSRAAARQWSWFLGCGVTLLLGPWFLGVLTAYLWEAAPRARDLTLAGFATSLTALALLAAAGVSWGLFVYLGTGLGDGSLLLLLAESRHFAEGSVSFPLAGAVGAFTLAARGRLPAWRAVAVIGAVAAGLLLAHGIDDFVAAGVTGPLGLAAFAALLAWLLAISLALVAGLAPASSLSRSARPAPEPALQP